MCYRFTPSHPCPCGSGLSVDRHYDARGIYLCGACEQCWPEKRQQYRPDVLTDPDYWHDEPIDEDD